MSTIERDMKCLSKFMGGDTRAFETLISFYEYGLRMYIKKIVGEVDCDDVYNETLITVYQKINFYKPIASFKTWLFTVGRNKCYDHLRIKKRQGFCEYNDSIGDTTDFKTRESDIILGENAKILFDAVTSLSPQYKNVIVLRYYLGYRYKDIAIALDIADGTVKANLFRAKEKLRGYMENIIL